ncbi:hypothetical protein TUBRATIS_000500 [Tubulinosema ratisbonensis]|uniref:Uncharacterized protein n=1 Tax=Tubulinosema ratisbonensis TaxID=291195 RepID=A0A437AQK9_9MICR|nr:hypothetical protein TUBRATIS_000500 [Tubulinosema ratisbonensis]
MFEIFFYAYEFDTGKFNKYQLKDLVNHFNFEKFQNFFERIYFDDLIKSQNKSKQWLDKIYSNKLITEDFYLEVKGLFENIFELTGNIFKEVDLYAKVYKSIMKKLDRFIEKMEMIVQEDDE